MNAIRLWAIASGAVLACLASSSRASAEPTPPAGGDQAERRFNEGIELSAAGRYGDACPKFEESQRLDPAIGTQYNLAECYAHTGRTASAWALFLEVAKAARAAGKSEREKASRTRAEALASRLPRLHIVLARPDASVVVSRDGTRLTGDALTQAVPVDPGAHVIEASAPGKATWATKVIAIEASTIEVIVPTLEAARPAGPATGSATGAASPEEEGRAPLRTVGLVVSGVGIVGLGLGAVFGLRAGAKNRESNADGHCDASGCDADGTASRKGALDAATASTVSFVAGGALLAGGLVLFFTAKPSAPSARASIIVSPSARGLGVSGTW